MSKYDMLEVENDGQILLMLVMVDKKGSMKRYTTYAQLLEAIQEHEDDNGKHTGRLLTVKKLNTIFTNIIYKKENQPGNYKVENKVTGSSQNWTTSELCF